MKSNHGRELQRLYTAGRRPLAGRGKSYTVILAMPLKPLAITLALLVFFVCAPLASHSPALAQGNAFRVSGAVVAATGGAPLAGVAVSASGSGGSTRTNAKGRFSLTIAANGPVRLTFSLRGYRPVTKAIDSSTSAVIVSMTKQ